MIKNKEIQENSMKKLSLLLFSIFFISSVHAISVSFDDVIQANVGYFVDWGQPNGTEFVITDSNDTEIGYQTYRLALNIPDETLNENQNKILTVYVTPFCPPNRTLGDELVANIGFGSTANNERVNLTDYCDTVDSGSLDTTTPTVEVPLGNFTSNQLFTRGNFNLQSLVFYFQRDTIMNQSLRQAYTVNIDTLGITGLIEESANENTLEDSILRLWDINLTIWEIGFYFVLVIAIFYGFLIFPLRALSVLSQEVKKLFR